MNQAVSEKIKLVICLDSLSYANDLTVHVGNVKHEHEEFVKNTLKTLKTAGGLYGKPVNFNKKFLPTSFYEWEHLRYSENNIAAFTITSHPQKAFSNMFEKFSLYDTEFDIEAF